MGKKGFIAFSPHIARKYFESDVVTAIYYEKLLRYDAILDKDTEGFFTRTSEQIENSTCIKRRQQDRVRKWLEQQGYVLTCIKIPIGKTAPQLHFKIVDKKQVT